MDTQARSTTRDLGPFGPEIRRFSMMQAISHVCDYLVTQGHATSEDEAYELIRFRANPSQGFAASDVQGVEWLEQGDHKILFTINLLGLFGASSPLPGYYNDYVSRSDEPNVQIFLDIFHHRIHRLIRDVWKKYRYRASFRHEAKDAFSASAFSLIGLRSEAMRSNKSIDWARLLPYLGLLSQQVRSAAVIEAVLRYYFSLPHIDIEQCTSRQSHIVPWQKNRLGSANTHLSHDAVLGEQVSDRANKFSIHIRQLSWDRFHQFLKGEQDWLSLVNLVQFSVKDPLDYDVQLHLAEGEPKPLRLAQDNSCRLGWTSWIGDTPSDSTITLTSDTQGVNS